MPQFPRKVPRRSASNASTWQDTQNAIISEVVELPMDMKKRLQHLNRRLTDEERSRHPRIRETVVEEIPPVTHAQRPVASGHSRASPRSA